MEGNIMKSGDIFSDNDPHLVHTEAQYVRTVCCVCNGPININTIYKINDVASCSFCYTDYTLSRNVCPCPYRKPRPRKLVNRTELKDRASALIKEMEIEQVTSSAATTIFPWSTAGASHGGVEAFTKNPGGGV